MNSQNVIIGDETQIVVFLSSLLTESDYANYLAQTDLDYRAVSQFANSEPLVKTDVASQDRYRVDTFSYVLFKRRHFSQPTKLPDIGAYLTGPMTELAKFTNDFARWANLNPEITGNLITFFLYQIAVLKIAPSQAEALLFEVVGTDAIFLQLCYQSLRTIPECAAFTTAPSQEATTYSTTIRDELIRLLIVCKFGFTNSRSFHLLDQTDIPLYTTAVEENLYNRVKQVATRSFCELGNANWSQQIDFFSRSLYLLMSSLKSDYALAKRPPQVTIFIQHANNNELVHLIQNKLQLVFGKEKVAFIESVADADIVIVNNIVDLVQEAHMKDPDSLLNDRRLHLYSLTGLTNSGYFNKLINDLSTTLLSRVS